MKRRLNRWWMWLAVCVGMLGATEAFAAFEAKPPAGLLELSGRVAMVDVRKKVLAVERIQSFASPKQQEFRIDTQTTISDGHRQLTLDHVLPGQEVVIHYAKGDADRPIAHSVMIRETSPSAETTPPAASGAITQPGGSAPATP